MRAGAEIFHTLRAALKAAGHNTNVGDEGGFAPNLPSAEAALDFVLSAIEKAGYQAGRRCRARARSGGERIFQGRRLLNTKARARRARSSSRSIISPNWSTAIRSSRSKTAWPRTTSTGWKKLTQKIGDKCQLVGDDVFVTNVTRLADGIKNGIANSILIKVNQIGTLTETLAAVEMAHKAGYTAVMSHRSGETEDSTIADLAVATNCGQIKTGSLARSDRTAKYNQLLRIEEELGAQAAYAGRAAFKALG